MSVPPVSNPNRDLPAIMDREEVLIVARLAEQSEQYDDMIGLLKPYIESKTDDLEATIYCFGDPKWKLLDPKWGLEGHLTENTTEGAGAWIRHMFL